MNLSKHEGQVLVAIFDESCETRRDVRTDMACIAANAGTSAQRAVVMLALAKMKRLGLLVTSDQGQAWGPTQDGRQVAQAIKSGAIKCHPEKVAQNPVDKPELVQSTPEPAPQAGPALVQPPSIDIEKPASPIPADLLDRCAAMTATLLAQSKQRYAQGHREAAGELGWLMETGQMLLAAGGGRG